MSKTLLNYYVVDSQQSTEVGQSKKLLAKFCQFYDLLKLFKSKKVKFNDLIGRKIYLFDFEMNFLIKNISQG